MENPVVSNGVLYFGVFEVDRVWANSASYGLRLKLQGKPFQILLCLLERPGEPVSREELRRRLWDSSTYVDFEHNLDNAVNKLREALSDDPDNPRFIETIPRRGYRFVGEVNGNHGNDAGQIVLERLEPSLVAPVLASKKRPLAIYSSAAVLILLALAGAIYYWTKIPTAIQVPRISKIVQLSSDGKTKNEKLVFDEGSRVFFNEKVDDKWVVASVPVRGGKTTVLPLPLEGALLQGITRDGTELLVLAEEKLDSGHPLYIVSTFGGDLYRVGTIAAEHAGFSSDGERIVYTLKGSLYIVNRDGNGSRKILQPSGVPLRPRFSPDGSVIRFSLLTPNSFRHALWEVRADGSNAHQVLHGRRTYPLEDSGTWNQEGSYYLFGAFEHDSDSMWVLAEKGRALNVLGYKPYEISTGVIDPYVGTFSKDGKRIYLVGADRHGQFMRLDAKAGRWSKYLPALSGEWLAVSRDGNWAAYVDESTHSLWRARTDGSEKLRLTFPPILAGKPVWSPTGSKIAFMAREGEKPWGVYVVDGAGGPLKRITDKAHTGSDPSWSPDGTRLLDHSHTWVNGAETGPGSFEIFDFANKRIETIPPTQYFSRPLWSPDGRVIGASAVSNDKGTGELAFYDMTERKWSRWKIPMPVEIRGFSHDSKYVYCNGYSGGLFFYRLRISDGTVQPIPEKSKFDFLVSAIGPFIGVSPEDDFVVSQDLSVVEVYALDWDAP